MHKLIDHLEVLGNLPNKPLEWKLPDEQLRALLVLADLTGKSSTKFTHLRILQKKTITHARIGWKILHTEEQQFQGGNSEASSLLQLWEQTYGQPVKKQSRAHGQINNNTMIVHIHQ